MKRLTIRIRSDESRALDELGARFTKAWKSGRSSGDTLQFESPAALFRLLTPKRWDLVGRLQQLGPSTIRGLARALGRDVKRVHQDVTALLACGLIVRGENRKVVVPYAVIHADFDLRAVA
jgi:predicted transcriptional regulator